MTAMVRFREVIRSDIDQLYAIALATGDNGRDAAPLYRDGRMIGHIYAAPYAELCPQDCFVAEDDDGVGGYVVGTLDTRAFEALMEQYWWPPLRDRYAKPNGDPSKWNADERRAFMIHHPRTVPEEVVRSYPAHVHMNFLPRMQGRGLGRALLDHWLWHARELGVEALHIATGHSNMRAVRFWQACGFVLLAETPNAGSNSTLWYGRRFGDADQPERLHRT